MLGSHLLMRLAERGENVRAIYRSEKKLDDVRKAFDYYDVNTQELLQKIEWIQADVLDVLSLQEALNGVTQVYHCAGVVTFIPSEGGNMNAVNVNGTANVVNLCLDDPNIRLCHVSSVAALGRDQKDDVISEKNEWKETNYNAAYSVSKYRGEMEVWRGLVEGLNAFIVNPSLIIGPGGWSQSTGAMFRRSWKGMPFFTPGGNCFVDVLDVADAMIRLMQTDIRNERFIIGAENRLFKDVFGRIAENMGKKPPKYEATEWMAQLTWRIEKVVSAISGKKPFITKETAHHAMSLSRYDNSKMLNALGDFSYRDLNESVDFICAKFMEDMRANQMP